MTTKKKRSGDGVKSRSGPYPALSVGRTDASGGGMQSETVRHSSHAGAAGGDSRTPNPTKKPRPRRNICPTCDQPTGKASATHTCKPKATRTSTRTSCPDCGKVNPADIHSCTPTAIRLQLTDRMKEQGVAARVRTLRTCCIRCGRLLFSNGTTQWCISCEDT